MKTTVSLILPILLVAAIGEGPTPALGSDLNGTSRGLLAVDARYVFNTFLGGSGREGSNTHVAVDTAGNVYVAGFTRSDDFPLVSEIQSALSETYAGDAFVAKIAPEGGRLLFSSYLGGNGFDHVTGIAADDLGVVTVIGHTTSDDFPLVHPLQTDRLPDRDWFVSRVDTTTGVLLFSSYLGGTRADTPADIVNLTGGGIAIVGNTASPDFPSIGALPGTRAGDDIGSGSAALVVLDWTPNGAKIRLSTHLPGIDATAAMGIAEASENLVYVVGRTESDDLPTGGRFQATKKGRSDGYICGVPLDSLDSTFCSYLGGSAEPPSRQDHLADVAVAPSGDTWVAGSSSSFDFPVRGPVQQFPGAQAPTAVVARLSPDLGELRFSTFLGGVDFDGASSIAVDQAGRALVGGYSDSEEFPIVDPGEVVGAGGFLSLFDSDDNLLFSTRMGGSRPDDRGGLTAGGSNEFVVGSWTTDGQSFRHPVQAEFGGQIDALVSKIKLLEVPDEPPTETPNETFVCPALNGRAPQARIDYAVANPGQVRGWGKLCYPSRPPSPWNGYRRYLTLQTVAKPYHPLFNPIVFGCGCS